MNPWTCVNHAFSMHKHHWLAALSSFWLRSPRLSLFICLLRGAFGGNESLPPAPVSQRWAAWPPGAWLISHHYPISAPLSGFSSFCPRLYCHSYLHATSCLLTCLEMGRRTDGVAGRLMEADVFGNFISALSFKFHERKREGWNQDYCICSMGDSSPAG